MATINTEIFCGGLAEGYGWPPEKVARLERILRERGIHRSGVEQRLLDEALEELERQEKAGSGSRRKDASRT